MSTTATAPPPVPAAAPPGPVRLYRINVDEYARIGEFLRDPRVELLDGQLVAKMPKNAEHSYTTGELFQMFAGRAGDGWTPRQEQPVRISEFDEPEPDIAIVRGSRADYKHRKPTAADVALLVEVSDSSLPADRGPKLLAYARAGIPVYWIVNLIEHRIEAHTGPGPSGYQTRRDYRAGELVPVSIGGVDRDPIAVNDILP